MFKNRKKSNKSVNQLKEYKLIDDFSTDFHPSHHKMIKIPQYYQENTQFRLDKAAVDHQFIRPTSIEEDFFFKDFAKDAKSKRQSFKHNSSNHHYSPPISSFDLSTFAKDLHDHRYTTLMQQNTITEDNHIPLSPIPSSSSFDNDGSNKIAVEDDINDFVPPQPLPRIKRSVSTACHNRPSVHFQEPPKATRKSLSMNDMIAEEKKKKKKSFFGSFRSSTTKAPDQHGMSRAAMAVIQHNVDQFIQPPTTTNKRDTKISSFLSRASSTARKRNTKIVNMQRNLPKRDEIVRKTIIYVQPDSLHQLLKHGGNGVCIPPQTKYTSDQESLSSDESYMEGVELREMKDGTVTWGVVKKQGNRKSFYARYDDHQFEFVEEEELINPPPIPKRSPHRDDIYYSKDLTLPHLVKLMNDQYPTMSVDDQLDEMIQIIKSQQ